VGRRLSESLYESILPGEGRLAGEHLVQNAAETVNVRARIDGPIAEQLLGTHVCGGAGPRYARHRELSDVSEIDCSRDTEVGDDRVAAGEKNVLRFDVAVDDALAMSIGQRVRRLARNGTCGLDPHLPLAVHPYAQSLAHDVRHDIVEQRFDVTRVVERKDVGVLETGDEADLPDEADLAGLRFGVCIQDLDRDFPFVLQIAR
jgi:hypothetical protein